MAVVFTPVVGRKILRLESGGGQETRVASRTLWSPKALSAYYNARTVLTGKNHRFLTFCICLQAHYSTLLKAFYSVHTVLTQCSLSAHYNAHTVLTVKTRHFCEMQLKEFKDKKSFLCEIAKCVVFTSENCVSTVVSTE